MSAESVAMLRNEMEMLHRELKAIETSYGQNVLNLTVARGYIRKLLANALVSKFLSTNHGDLFSEFQAIAAMESL